VNTKSLNFITAGLFLATAVIWFFSGNRMLSVLFAIVAVMFVGIGLSKSKQE